MHPCTFFLPHAIMAHCTLDSMFFIPSPLIPTKCTLRPNRSNSDPSSSIVTLPHKFKKKKNHLLCFSARAFSFHLLGFLSPLCCRFIIASSHHLLQSVASTTERILQGDFPFSCSWSWLCPAGNPKSPLEMHLLYCHK